MKIAPSPFRLRLVSIFCFLVVGLLTSSPLWSDPELLIDLDTSAIGSEPSVFTPLGEEVIFTAQTAEHGREIWISDGTSPGTRLLLDLYPGPGSLIGSWKVIHDRLFAISVQPPQTGQLVATQPWSPSFAEDPGAQVLLDGVTQFVESWQARAVVLRETSDSAIELWTSDGTPGGTSRVGSFGSEGWPEIFDRGWVIGDRLVFSGWVPETGREPWAIHLISGEAELLRDFLPGTASGVSQSFLSARVGELVFFQATDPNVGRELWITDGTPAGTDLLADVEPGSGSSRASQPVLVGERLFFVGDDFDLWVSDGTPFGTRRVAPSQDFSPLLFDVADLDGHIVFEAVQDGDNEPWISDGTDAGTYRILDLRPGGSSTADIRSAWQPTGSQPLAAIVARTDEGVRIPWITDGTAAGTYSLPGLSWPDVFGSGVPMRGIGDLLWMQHDDGIYGSEPWVWDGSSARLLKDLDTERNQGSNPTGLIAAGELAFFERELPFPQDPTIPRIWSTDGTAEGTVGVEGSQVLDALSLGSGQALGNTVYFMASQSGLDQGRRIYRIRGRGPLERLTLDSDSQYFDVRALAVAGGILYFVREIDGDLELWRLDAADRNVFLGTVAQGADDLLVADHASLVADHGEKQVFDPPPYFLIPWGDRLAVFAVQDDGDGYLSDLDLERLWISDGTVAGTQVVAEVSFIKNTSSNQLTQVGDLLYFAGKDETFGQEIWVSDGTTAGTGPMVDLTLGSAGSSFVFAHPDLNSSNRMFFTTSLEGEPRSLWWTDGTEAGTERLLDEEVLGGSMQGVPQALADGVLFELLDAQGQWQLWRWTPALGPTKIFDLDPAPPRAVAQYQAVFGGRVYFTFESQTYGTELFVTDGTAEGTGLVSDLAPGPAGSSPGTLVRLGDDLLWAANDGVHGSELWVEDPGCLPDAQTLCLGEGRFRVRVAWRDFEGGEGVGSTRELTADTGGFWFFDPENIEMNVKVLDGRLINGHFWVFVGSLTNVQFELTVEDTETGETASYTNPLGTFASFGDTEALAAGF